MNLDLQAGLQLATAVVQAVPDQADVEAILLPPYTHLSAINALLPASGTVQLGAQNCHEQAQGAFTGEIAASMLRAVGARYVLIGHSERRQQWDEESTLLAQKLTAALGQGLRPIFCCGEHRATREAAEEVAFVQQQLAEGLFHLSAAEMAQVVVAYEPVWAIGTGETPQPAQVQAMHQAIREAIARQYHTSLAQSIPILYGGSCNAQNAASFFACPDVDGGLIGSASLQADSFVAIVQALIHTSG